MFLTIRLFPSSLVANFLLTHIFNRFLQKKKFLGLKCCNLPFINIYVAFGSRFSEDFYTEMSKPEVLEAHARWRKSRVWRAVQKPE